MQQLSGGAADLSQLQATMQAIEQACSSIQMHINPAAAEATILALRQSARPYQSCQFILENSQLANARFQAAAAIRDAAIREWGFLTPEEKRSLITFCLCFVMKNANSTDAYVQAKVSAVGAQLMKRGWPDFTVAEQDTFFTEIKQAVLGNHGVDAQSIGINFLESLVSEFSPSTYTPMGLPAEFHEQCRASLEVDYLKSFYCWAQDSAVSVTDKLLAGSNTTAMEVKVCSTALRLMFQILNWDFQSTKSSAQGNKNRLNPFRSGVRNDNMMVKKSECTLVQPGPAWHDVLISSGHIGWLLGLYGTLRQKFSHDNSWVDSPLAVSARQLIVQLCSLTGTVFSSDSDPSNGHLLPEVKALITSIQQKSPPKNQPILGNGQMQEIHLLQMLSGIIQWIDPPDAILTAIRCGKSESEMLDGCRALFSIATLATPLLFDRLLKSVGPFGTISLLSALTCEVIRANVANNNEEETWSSEALDILLDTWNVLLEPTCYGKNTLSHEGINAAAIVFNSILESELKVAADSAFEDGDDSDNFQASISARDERLSSYALIGRAAASFTIPLLTRVLSERVTLLQQGCGKTDPTCTLEELYWLVLLAGHVLADAGEGETPLVPEALQSHFTNIAEAAQHPVVALSVSIINFAEQSLDQEMRAAFFSPRVMEAVVWFLARWSDTYLMHEASKGHSCPPENEFEHLQGSNLSRKALLSFCGEHDQGKRLLDIVVRISMETLISYPGETDLQAITCYQLLPSLVRRRNVCVHLVASDSWQRLATTFAKDRNLFSLSGPLQRSLAESLCRSAVGLKSSEASNQYVRDLMGHMTAYLVEISSKNDLKSLSQRSDAKLMVSYLLERLRGAARATQPRTQKALFDIGAAVMNSVLSLLQIYKHESAVVYALLKFVVDWVDGQVAFLEAKDTALLVSFCMQLLQIYSSHNIGKISLSLSSSLLNEEKTEKYKDLRALLQLLTNLCSKDLVDFSSDSDEVEKTDIGQVVYLGLHIVSPLISLDLLKYPKLCRDYFALLSHILELYPEKVAQLNVEAFAHTIGTLDFGLHHQDAEVVNKCLSALNALGSYHYKERSAGKQGLGDHTEGFGCPDGRFQEGILSRFLQSLLQWLLLEEYSTELVGAAADALLPLILCEQGLYQRLGNELMERQVNPIVKSRLANALYTLTSSNGLSSSLDRGSVKATMCSCTSVSTEENDHVDNEGVIIFMHEGHPCFYSFPLTGEVIIPGSPPCEIWLAY